MKSYQKEQIIRHLIQHGATQVTDDKGHQVTALKVKQGTFGNGLLGKADFLANHCGWRIIYTHDTRG